MDIPEADLNDPYWADQIKVLPDGRMLLVREIRAALNGEPFRFFENEGTPATWAEATTREERVHYFSIFHHCEEWGLPNGGGWAHELPWVIQFLSHMKHVKRLIEIEAQRKAIARTGK